MDPVGTGASSIVVCWLLANDTGEMPRVEASLACWGDIFSSRTTGRVGLTRLEKASWECLKEEHTKMINN